MWKWRWRRLKGRQARRTSLLAVMTLRIPLLLGHRWWVGQLFDLSGRTCPFNLTRERTMRVRSLPLVPLSSRLAWMLHLISVRCTGRWTEAIRNSQSHFIIVQLLHH